MLPAGGSIADARRKGADAKGHQHAGHKRRPQQPPPAVVGRGRNFDDLGIHDRILRPGLLPCQGLFFGGFGLVACATASFDRGGQRRFSFRWCLLGDHWSRFRPTPYCRRLPPRFCKESDCCCGICRGRPPFVASGPRSAGPDLARPDAAACDRPAGRRDAAGFRSSWRFKSSQRGLSIIEGLALARPFAALQPCFGHLLAGTPPAVSRLRSVRRRAISTASCGLSARPLGALYPFSTPVVDVAIGQGVGHFLGPLGDRRRRRRSGMRTSPVLARTRTRSTT